MEEEGTGFGGWAMLINGRLPMDRHVLQLRREKRGGFPLSRRTRLTSHQAHYIADDAVAQHDPQVDLPWPHGHGHKTWARRGPAPCKTKGLSKSVQVVATCLGLAVACVALARPFSLARGFMFHVALERSAKWVCLPRSANKSGIERDGKGIEDVGPDAGVAYVHDKLSASQLTRRCSSARVQAFEPRVQAFEPMSQCIRAMVMRLLGEPSARLEG